MSVKKALRILLVDDDEDLLDLLKYNLKKEGFHVKTVNKVKEAIAVAVKFQPQLVILDIFMPDGSGIDLCREIRALNGLNNATIFFLSACSESTYKNATLETGGDDFIEKLSGLRVLTNKVIAVLRNQFVIRKRVPTVSSNDLVINKRTEVVYYRNQEMQLSKPEFEILFFMMQNPNKVVSQKVLVNIIWGSEIFMIGSPVENYIENLQKKIGRRFIETVSNGQYRFNML